MKNATVSWDLPTTRESGLPLDPADIQGVEVSLSADGGTTFSVLNTVAPPDTELLVPDLEIGDWVFRLAVVDTNGRRSADVDALFNIADETAPSAVVNVQVALS